MINGKFLKVLRPNKNVLAAIVIITSALLLHSAVFKTRGFMPKDDWNMILVASDKPFHPQIEKYGGAYRSFYGYALKKDIKQVGRFRPLFWLLSTIKVHFFRNAPLLWQLETLLIGIMTCICLYFIALRLHFSWMTSLFCSLWFLLRGGNLWVEKQLQETPGMLFTMLAILFIIEGAKNEKISKWDWFGLLSIALAGFIKESFILLIPAIFVLRLTLSCCLFNNSSFIKTLKNLKGLVFAYVLSFALLLGIAFLAYYQGKYSAKIVGTSPFAVSNVRWISMIISQSGYLSYFLPALGILFLIPSAIKNKLVLKRSAAVGSVLLLWLIPQLILYSNSGFRNHYVYPAILAMIFFNALGLNIIKRMKLKMSSYLIDILFVIALIPMVFSVPTTFNRAEHLIAVANVFSDSTKQVIKSAKDDSAILFLPRSPLFGLGASYLTHISEAGVFIPAFYDSSSGKSGKISSHSRLLSRIYHPFKEEDTSKIDIIITTYPQKEFLRKSHNYNWFKRREWRVHRFPIKFRQLEFKIKKFLIDFSFNMRKVEYCVLVRKQNLVRSAPIN